MTSPGSASKVINPFAHPEWERSAYTGRHRRPDIPSIAPCGRHRAAEPATETTAADKPPASNFQRYLRRPAKPAPNRAARRHRRRSRLRPAITTGLVAVGASALVAGFVTPMDARPEETHAFGSRPVPTTLLAALVDTPPPPVPAAGRALAAAGPAAAAALVGVDLDADLLLRGDIAGLLAALGASLNIDLDVEVAAEAFASLINDIAIGLDGGFAGVNGAVDLGAALVAQIVQDAAAAAVDVQTAITGALLSLLGALTPEGGVGAELAASIGGAIEGIADLLAAGTLGAGAAVAWKVTLDDVLVDLFATGGIALVNGLAGGLLGALDIQPVGLPDIDGADVAAALAAVIDHFAVGIDGALLTWNGAVDVGAAVVADIALTAAAVGASVPTAIAGAFLATLETLVPEGSFAAPFAELLADTVGGVTTLINTGILGAGEAIAWKATLDDVLADLVATAGVALTNGVALGLVDLIGGPVPDLPDIDGGDVAVAVGNLFEHFTDGISGGLLTFDDSVDLGVALVANFARAIADGGVELNAALAGGFLGALDLLVPGGELPDAVGDAVAGFTGVIDAGIEGLAEAVAWKANLDEVLVDLVAAGGIELVAGLAGGLFGSIGLPLPDLPDVDFAASVRALINHFAVGLGLDLDLDVGVEVDAEVDVDAGVDLGGEVGGDGEGEPEPLSQRSSETVDEQPVSDSEPVADTTHDDAADGDEDSALDAGEESGAEETEPSLEESTETETETGVSDEATGTEQTGAEAGAGDSRPTDGGVSGAGGDGGESGGDTPSE